MTELVNISNEELLLINGGGILNDFLDAANTAFGIVEVVTAVPVGILVGVSTANPVAGVATAAFMVYDGSKRIDND